MLNFVWGKRGIVPKPLPPKNVIIVAGYDFEHDLFDTRDVTHGVFQERFRYVLPDDLSELLVERDWDSPFAWTIRHLREGWNEHYPWSNGIKPVYSQLGPAMTHAVVYLAYLEARGY